MFKKFKIGKTLIIATLSVVVFSLIGFVEKRQSDRTVEDVIVHINFDDGNSFIDENDILNLMTHNDADHIKGKKYTEIDLKTLEQRIKAYRFVENAQVYKDHKGNLIVDVQQCKPVARLIRTNGPHAYIDSKGKVLSTSEKYTPRVLLIDGPYVKMLMNEKFLAGDTGIAYMDLIRYIENDKFWRAQIAQLSIDQDGDISMYPQVGNQLIVFGQPEDVEKKFIKLNIFYRKIIPSKGWNTYHTITVKFKDQIICE